MARIKTMSTVNPMYAIALRKDHCGPMLNDVSNVFSKGTFDAEILTMLVEATVVEMDRMTPFLDVIAKSSAVELIALDVPSLLQREDLLPNIAT